MADKGAQDKTEKPTSRRRQKAREQGQVVKSQELNSVAVLITGLMAIWMGGGYLSSQISNLMRETFANLAQINFSPSEAAAMISKYIGYFLLTAVPVWLAVFAAAALVNIAQVGFLLAPKRLKPDLSKLSPLKGIKKLFALRTFVEAIKNILKLVIVGFVAYITVRSEWENLPDLGQEEVIQIVSYIIDVCFTIFWRCVLAMFILAVLDWSYQKYEHEKELKMSKQEVKDEYKQTEGDPQVKSRIRSLQREQARNRMMAEVPQADVVVTNPTHLAVALAYRSHEMDAPEVVAKGANKIALKIKEVARENGVPVIEDKPLAQALFKAVEVGQSIPGELYEAVATILAHVYRMKNRHREVLNRAGKGS
jgi:flagellar biosynthetic protein FlhB